MTKENYSPEDSLVLDRLRARKRKIRRRIVLLCFIAFIMLAAYTYVKNLYPWNVLQTIKLNSITVTVNGNREIIQNGGVLTLGTEDFVRLEKVDTTSLFELGTQVLSNLFSVETLRDGMKVEQALVHADWLSNGDRYLEVTYHAKPVGSIALRVKPTKLFWIKRASVAKDPTRKISYLKEAEKLDPQSILLKIQLAGTLEEVGRLKEAIAYYGEISEKDPRPQWLDKLIALNKRSGNKAELDKLYERRASIQPSKDIFMEAAAFAEETNDWARAARYYREAELVAPKQEKRKILKRLGFAYVSSNQLTKGILAYEDALKLDPQDVNLYYNLAELYRLNGDSGRYAEYLERVLKIIPELENNPEELKTRMRLIRHYAENEQVDEEIRHLKALLKKNPSKVEFRKRVAQLYEKQGNDDLLLEEYEKLVELEPTNKVLLFNVGVLLFKAEHYEKSAAAFQNLVALDPTETEGHIYLLEIYRKLGKKTESLEQAKTLLSINPKNLEMYDLLFVELGETPRKDSLIPILQKGIEENPECNRLREYLGLIHLENNDVREAIIQFEKATELGEKKLSILYNLAKLHESVQDVKKAREYYKQVMDIDESYKDARESYLGLSMKQLD